MAHSASASSSHAFLLLIENSPALALYWPDLQNSYLPRLVEQLRGPSYPTHGTNVYISESRGDTLARPYNSLDVGLKEVRFTSEPGNRLSTTQIQAGVEFLASQSIAHVRHLIVVATTPPAELAHIHNLHNPWHKLAKMLTQVNVRFHLALTSNLRSGRLPDLFEQTLKWQRNTEEPLWLPTYSTSFIFRVSAQPRYPYSATQAANSTRFMDMYTTKSLSAPPPPLDSSPTLVSQLQQVHGLTKKKVYGTKPERVPFIREDSDTGVRERYRQAPTPLYTQPSASLPECTDASTFALAGGGVRDRSGSRSNPRVESRTHASRHHRLADPYASPRRNEWPMHSSDAGDSSPYASSSLSLPSDSHPPNLNSSSVGHSGEQFPWEQMSTTPSSTKVYHPSASDASFSVHNDVASPLAGSFRSDLAAANVDVSSVATSSFLTRPVPLPFPTSNDYVPPSSTSYHDHAFYRDVYSSQSYRADTGTGTRGQSHDSSFTHMSPASPILGPASAAPSSAFPWAASQLRPQPPETTMIQNLMPSPALLDSLRLHVDSENHQGLEPPTANGAGATSRYATSNTRNADSGTSFGSSSSSLTGWAG